MEVNTAQFVRHLDELAAGYQRAAILFTANNAGVFSLLEQARTAEEVSRALGWSLRGTRMLLDGLVALELALKEDEAYRNAPIASQCLVPGAPADQTHIMSHRAGGWPGWSRLGEAVRTGTAVPRLTPERSPEELRAFICGMADVARLNAHEVVDAVNLSRYTHLLDLGGGPGVYAVAFLQRYPNLCATIFDYPAVVSIAREEVQRAGLVDRVRFAPGDFTRDPLGEGYDVVFLSSIIHQYSSQANRALIRKCYDALVPGGLLIIKDFLVDTGRTGPPFALIFALQMLVHTEAGDTYTADEVAEWCKEAGFSEGKYVSFTSPTRLWLAGKA